ncbi:MAG TPA: Gfo/Idh/MocA family oxidoreductase [Chloroflexota bacterium]|nr:Gfo/Idh/MocA family oxidoreductase [Chloroflexota bacterium]
MAIHNDMTFGEPAWDHRSQIGLGVIGIGNIARACIRAVTGPESSFQVRAVCGLEADRLARTTEEFRIPYATREYQDLLARHDVDAVAIYSPDALHFPMIRDALLAGKDVVVTKPMVISTEEAAQVLALEQQTGRTVLVGETSRYDQRTLAAHRLWQDGDLGRLIFGETHYVHDMRSVFDRTPWRYQEPHAKDFPIGSMCHPVALITMFFGDVEEVSAFGVNGGMDPRYPAHREDTYLVNLRFKNGAIGRVLGAYGLVHPPLPMESLSLFGTKGSLVNNDVVLDKMPGRPVIKLNYRAEGGYDGHSGQIYRYMEELARCMRDGGTSTSPAIDGAKTVAVGEAIKESVRAGGRPVTPRTAF